MMNDRCVFCNDYGEHIVHDGATIDGYYRTCGVCIQSMSKAVQESVQQREALKTSLAVRVELADRRLMEIENFCNEQLDMHAVVKHLREDLYRMQVRLEQDIDGV